ncbi:electron transfer flavoprotein subunit beta/FixA family protein [Desulfopila aestuarii]|uniref:Electron transfer flavoprotein beta subunit n=1 Tax=Desulfopila aestuarii DSM 18488 TaxID=1121416 RepID=A0A1M7Y6L6_9BACT|nr:electron transfer flavoprotein subunit beta/FixA family protein [Desulfopila aestuarii]SHO48156.1 electron transfer flavoprotein beta subunit [Desulfopila aestuarii DSM 18488]
MKILICIKPNITGQEIGPLEAHAVEAGLRLKDSDSSCLVDVITAGPPKWANILHRALGMGADNAFHILTDHKNERPDGLVPASETAELLSRALTCTDFTPEYDLILTGIMSQDLMAGQVGPMLAVHMQITFATGVVRLNHQSGSLACHRDWEGGKRETLEIPLPALVSIQAGHYTPRYPSLSNILKAASAEIQTITLRELDLAGMQPDAIFLDTIEPQKSRAGEMINGSIEKQVRIFTSFLQERALL